MNVTILNIDRIDTVSRVLISIVNYLNSTTIVILKNVWQCLILLISTQVHMMFALTMIVDLEWHDNRLSYKNLREGTITKTYNIKILYEGNLYT